MIDTIKKFGAIIEVVASLIRVLIPAVEVPGWGEEKKKLVLDVVKYFIDLVEEHFFKLPIDKQVFLNGVGWLIDIYVAFFNKVGEFVHSASVKVSGITTRQS